MEDNAATTRALVVDNAATPLLLLCAAPGEMAPSQTEAGVPALMPTMAPPSVATTSVLLSNVPLMVGVGDATGEFVVRMRGDSTGSAVFSTTMGALGCG